jgi:GNAT superfamily N-acetyltransferase
MTYSVYKLQKHHDLKNFDCNIDVLNAWLRTQARQAESKLFSSTYVLAESADSPKVLGFITMAMRGQIFSKDLPAELAKRQPATVPAYTLARLAVDKAAQGQRCGEQLLVFSLQLAKKLSSHAGGAFLVVDAKDGAVAFYEKYGFKASPSDPLLLFYRLDAAP